jgi:hypothetical protein
VIKHSAKKDQLLFETFFEIINVPENTRENNVGL